MYSVAAVSTPVLLKTFKSQSAGFWYPCVRLSSTRTDAAVQSTAISTFTLPAASILYSLSGFKRIPLHNKVAPLQIRPFQPDDLVHIQRILSSIGWDKCYIIAFEQAATHFAQNSNSTVLMANLQDSTIGFVFVEYHAWNRLAQIQGLAVDSAFQRHGAASALVTEAEGFARAQHARGIYVDTPTTNDRGRRFYEAMGYQVGYIMPRYYEEELDGVTYQKFFGEKGAY